MSPSEEDTQVGEGRSSAASGYAPEGDPIQRFLTALGRFERQIDRAQAGRRQDDWGEECMHQLVDALEIAIAQGWKDVVRTLTETARVLQSCSAAGEAPRCVPFLAEAYEILCMMVGDLIVGNVRSGVREDKWRARYARAVADLESAGIPLWADEEELAGASAGGSAPEPARDAEPEPEPGPELEPAGDVASEPEPERQPEAEPEAVEAEAGWSARPAAPTPEWAKADDLEPFPLDLDEEAYATADGSEDARERREWDMADAAPEEGPDAGLEAFDPAAVPGAGALTTDDFLDVEVEAEASDEAEADDWDVLLPGVSAEPAPEEAGDAAPFDVDEVEDAGDADDVACAETSDEAEAEAIVSAEAAEPEAVGDMDAGAGEDEGSAEAGDAVEEAVRPVLPQAVEQALDRFSERVERLSGEAPDGLETGWAELGEILRSLAEFAQEHGRDGALAPCMAMGRMVRLGAARRVVPDRRFTDLAFWFSGVYAEAGKRVSTPEIQDWLTECDDLLLSWATDAPVSAEKAAAAPEAGAGAEEREANPLWALLKTAQDAVAGGDPANAKTLALQAAAQIAEMQAKEAEAKVAEAERRLTDGTAECEQMRSAVREAEQAVAAAEEAAEQGRRALETTQARIAEAQDELAGLDASIDQIEEQIRALQAQREEALERKRSAGEQLEEAEARAVEEAEAVALREGAEREARAALEDARQRVTSLERRRVENETAMERARELLNRRRSALQEIEETIAQIRDADGDANDGGSGDQRNELLF